MRNLSIPKNYLRKNSTVLIASCLCLVYLSVFGRTLYHGDVRPGNPSIRHETLYLDGGSVSFNGLTAVLSPEAQAFLQHDAAVMLDNPELRLRVEGYTELHAVDAAHDALSQQRSATLREYLLRVGVPADHLTGSGFHYAKPSAARLQQARSRRPMSSPQVASEGRVQIFQVEGQ